MISQLPRNKTRHSRLVINSRPLFVVPRNKEIDSTNACSNHPILEDIERIDPISGLPGLSVIGRLFCNDKSQEEYHHGNLQDHENPLFPSQATNTPTSGSPRSCHSHLSSPEPIFDDERIKELLELVERRNF